MIAVGLVQSPLQLGAALLSIGLFASIYHPVGTAMIVSYADRLGREMGLNGVWGNLGVASSALVTGVVGQYLGWRWAFIVPGIVTIGIGVAFARMVVHEDRSGFKQAAAQARVAKKDMWRVILALFIVVIAISTTFNAVTVALPKLFAERLADMTKSPALLGVIAACVYVFGAMTQYTIGKLIDRYSLKAISLPLSFMLAPFLYLAATLSNLPLILASIGIVMGAFGQVTVNDAMVGKYTSEEWRSRAYSVRYFLGFTAAGASVGLVAWLYEQGGFVTMLHAFAGLCLLVIAAAIILPTENKVPATHMNPSSPTSQTLASCCSDVYGEATLLPASSTGSSAAVDRTGSTMSAQINQPESGFHTSGTALHQLHGKRRAITQAGSAERSLLS
jgi:MFS family permease